MGERGVHDKKKKQRRQSRGRLKSQWEEEQRGLDKVKGIRVLFYFVFCNKEKKKGFDSILASILPFIVWLLLPLCKLID